jgi:hypothetical protein
VAIDALPESNCQWFSSLDQTEEETETVPRIIILQETRPGEYPRRAIDRLRESFPAVPILLIAGSLCEGEGRTGRLPAGVVRRYWYEKETAIIPELKRFLRREPGRLSLPATAGEEDFWSAPPPHREEPDPDPLPLAARGTTVPLLRCAVIAADPGMRDLLADIEVPRVDSVLRLRFAADLLNIPRLDRLRKVVIDLTLPRTVNFLPIFRQIVRRYPEAEYVIHLFAPKTEELEAFATAAESVTVVPKPFAFFGRHESLPY